MKVEIRIAYLFKEDSQGVFTNFDFEKPVCKLLPVIMRYLYTYILIQGPSQ
jgi:hypothetical protein